MGSNNDVGGLQIDPGTLRILDLLAARWGVTREAAVKRAVAQAAPESGGSSSDVKMEALKELQRNLAITPEKAEAWQLSVREGRR
jgi:hypothetical protein